jgi:hypothetical protein
VAWILSSIIARSPDTANCTDWLIMTCRAATDDAVEGGVIFGLIVGSAVTGPLCGVSAIEPDGVADDDGAAMVVFEDTAVTIGTDKGALKEGPRAAQKGTRENANSADRMTLSMRNIRCHVTVALRPVPGAHNYVLLPVQKACSFA